MTNQLIAGHLCAGARCNKGVGKMEKMGLAGQGLMGCTDQPEHLTRRVACLMNVNRKAARILGFKN
jgi:hypothetical protein